MKPNTFVFSSLFKSFQVFSSLFKSFQVFSSLFKSFQVFSSLFKSVVILLFGALFLSSCDKDITDTPSLSQDKYSLFVKYEADIFMQARAVNENDAAKFTSYEKTSMLPVFKKVAVQMGINEDGTSDWVIEKKASKNNIDPIYKAPADPTRKATTVKIQGNIMTTFDGDGKMIKSRDYKVNAATKALLDLVRGNPMTQTLRNENTNIQTIIRTAIAEGATVSASADSMNYAIKKQIAGTDTYSISFLDVGKKRVTSSAIFKNNGERVYSSNLFFAPTNSGNNNAVLTDIVEWSFSNSPASGIPIVTEKTTHFTSFQQNGF
jgi:alpha-acetolactate decarboxylase